jgi:hypothetical protein
VEAFVARLTALIRACHDQTAHLAAHHATGPEGDWSAELLTVWLEQDLELFEFVWENRSLASLLQAGGGSAQFAYLIDEFMEQTLPTIRLVLEQGVLLGAYRADVDLEVASVFIAGLYDRLARLLVRQPEKPDLRAWLRTAQDLILRGIGSAAMRQAVAAPASEPVPHSVTRPSTPSPARPPQAKHSSPRGPRARRRAAS